MILIFTRTGLMIISLKKLRIWLLYSILKIFFAQTQNYKGKEENNALFYILVWFKNDLEPKEELFFKGIYEEECKFFFLCGGCISLSKEGKSNMYLIPYFYWLLTQLFSFLWPLVLQHSLENKNKIHVPLVKKNFFFLIPLFFFATFWGL